MSGPNGERDGGQLKIAKCKQTFAQMEKWASEELRMPPAPAAIFRRRHSRSRAEILFARHEEM